MIRTDFPAALTGETGGATGKLAAPQPDKNMTNQNYIVTFNGNPIKRLTFEPNGKANIWTGDAANAIKYAQEQAKEAARSIGSGAEVMLFDADLAHLQRTADNAAKGESDALVAAATLRAERDELRAIVEQVDKLTPATREFHPGIGAGMLNGLIESARVALTKTKEAK